MQSRGLSSKKSKAMQGPGVYSNEREQREHWQDRDLLLVEVLVQWIFASVDAFKSCNRYVMQIS